MTQDATGHAIDQERPYLLILFGLIGLLGCVALILGTIIAPFFVPEYNWVSDTISDLAAGQSEIIMDVALYGFAAGLFATALAASHAHLGGIFWSGGIFSLAVLAALVVVVGARNEYGDNDNEGIVIHMYLVYCLGVFFLLAPLFMAKGIGINHDWAMRTLIGLGLLWGITAPIFFLLPTTVDGLYERALGVIACAIVSTLCTVFVSRGRNALKSN
ncbi:DUF998 domain-containing protein [Parasulfitobacter algicola]|uniref:DUF998 domain-containing protein n=1 Tax=Parasulfitobacter algicola TaxID=2614809 RepID=A0ABX2IXV2_9RHOB|nr:DUF998 domain-containing protein [Sulfitobacter algicola]NSX55326.1 DUF998 domain-containing protein [Sulfitobacter algicola]